jgi:hypothetical protein
MRCTRVHALTLSQLGGVPALVKLLASDDREVLRNACLALTCCAKHPEALPQMYARPRFPHCFFVTF